MTMGWPALKPAPGMALKVMLTLTGFTLCGCRPVAPDLATSAPAAPPDSSRANLETIVDPLRKENEQLRQALELALTAQQDLTGQLRRDHDALASMAQDIGLLRERLHDLELARERQPVAAPASRVVQQRAAP